MYSTEREQQRMVEQMARRMAEQIVGNAPEGWTRAVLSGHAGRGGTGITGGYILPGPRTPMGLPEMHSRLAELAEAVRDDRGWDPVSWEMDCRPSGEFRLVVFRDSVGRVSGPGGGYEIVLDPDHRLPQPGTRQQAGTAAPAGDPELAAASFRAYLERRAAVLGHAEELPPPVTESALDDAERRIGRPLPADLRALYLIADGDGIGYRHRYLIENYAWLPLESLVAEYTDSREWQDRPWFGWDLEWDAVVFDTTPAETVRRCGGHPGWIRFASGEDGNYLAVDMAPARDGRPGQVIATGRDYDDGPVYVADSLTSLLGQHLELLERGSYETHDDHISLRLPGCDNGTRQIIGGIPEEVPPTLQAIHVNDATGTVDLSPLTAAPGLRRLHLNRSTTADLTPLRGLPVESVRVALTDGDLTALAGHPHLASLDLNTTAPADLTPLRSAPNLHGLDLSGAETGDLTVLADLANLRYLALGRRQWTTLLDHGKVPPALAAVRIAGDDVTFDDALALASRVGLDTGDALRVAGSL
ncbi:SMI1/KNR4 family protein [Streptomyces sp. NPDC057596]|uniref:SMI1/KNR4 family protein n=2 Tax=unclassified Streptomyces TaxID=2593676 RepID=UPI0036CAA7B6